MKSIAPTASSFSRPQRSQPLSQFIFPLVFRLGRGLDAFRRRRIRHFLSQFDASLVRDLVHQAIDILLGRGDGHGIAGGVLVVARGDVQILKLGLEPVHDRADLLQIHALHRRIHAPHHVRHAACDLAHGDGRLHARGGRVDARGQAEEVDFFVLLADGVLRVDFGNVRVVLLNGL